MKLKKHLTSVYPKDRASERTIMFLWFNMVLLHVKRTFLFKINHNQQKDERIKQKKTGAVSSEFSVNIQHLKQQNKKMDAFLFAISLRTFSQNAVPVKTSYYL